jgi:hypothetical protein
MSFVDKVKEQAEQVFEKAHHAVSQGQAKVDEQKAKRHAQSLAQDLGNAYYAQQREGGSDEAVRSALAAMDEHIAARKEKAAQASAAESADDAEETKDDTGAVTSGSVPADGPDAPAADQ